MTQQLSELNVKLYKKLYLIRRCEERIIELYPQNEMMTPMHMSMGSEHISVGVCNALTKNDIIFTSYRSHAPFIAKTNDTDLFFAELYGKDSSIIKGRGGSMHLFHPDYNFMYSSAIVASNIPVAVGCAYVNNMKFTGNTVCVFFGDGALDEGVFWESLNSACLMKLPMIFICEDNSYAVHTHKIYRQGYKSITNVVSNFNCSVFESSSTDVEKIYNITYDAILDTMRTLTPAFIHFKYYRYLEHVGTNYDFDANYRPKEIFDMWKVNDPIKLQRNKLKIIYEIGEDEIKDIETKIDNKIDESIEKAKNSQYCDLREIYSNTYKDLCDNTYNNEKNNIC